MTAKDAYQPIRKKHRWWLVYLTVAGIVFFSIWALAVAICYATFRDSSVPNRVVAVLIPSLVAISFLLVVLLGSRIFP